MALDPKSTLIRAISGAIYILIIVACCLCNEAGVVILACLLGVLAIIEFRKMHYADWNKDVFTSIYDIIGVLLLICSVFIVPFFCWIAWLIGRFVITIYSKHSHPEKLLAADLAGQAYIGVPLALMAAYGMLFSSGMAILSIFIIIWVNDTGAFLFGSLFGKHKLFERVSPKKSWEGFWGGLLCSVIAGLILSYFPALTTLRFSTINHPLMCTIAGVLISVSATYGDLFESVLKRNLNLKDSGHLIPGHGGILDRIDSLLFVLPVMTIYAVILSLLQ